MFSSKFINIGSTKMGEGAGLNLQKKVLPLIGMPILCSPLQKKGGGGA